MNIKIIIIITLLGWCNNLLVAQFSIGGGLSINIDKNWNQAFNGLTQYSNFPFLVNSTYAEPSMAVAFSAKYQMQAEYMFAKRFGIETQINMLHRFIKIADFHTNVNSQNEWSLQVPILFKWAFLCKNESPLLSLKTGVSLDAMVSRDSTIGGGRRASQTTNGNVDYEIYTWNVFYKHRVVPAWEVGLELNYPLDKKSSLRLTPHIHIPFQKNMYIKARRYYSTTHSDGTKDEAQFTLPGTPISIPYFSITLSYMYRFNK